MKKALVTLICMMSCFHAKALDNVLPSLYKVIATECNVGPKSRTLTGFRVNGYDGILTALHGVAGECEIFFTHEQSQTKPITTRIIGVDFSRDVALLYAPKKPHEAELIMGTEDMVIANSEVYAYGNILGLSATDVKLRIKSSNSHQILKHLLTTSQINYFKTRKSPTIEVRVINLQGPLTTGISGGPVLTASNNVVGVANGGQRSGAIDFSWAIPLYDVDIKPYNETFSQKLSQLGKLRHDLYFASDSSGRLVSNDDVSSYLRRILPQPTIIAPSVTYRTVRPYIKPTKAHINLPDTSRTGFYNGPMINPKLVPGHSSTLMEMALSVNSISIEGIDNNPYVVASTVDNFEKIPPAFTKSVDPSMFSGFGLSIYQHESIKEGLFSIAVLIFQDEFVANEFFKVRQNMKKEEDISRHYQLKGKTVVEIQYPNSLENHIKQSAIEYVANALKSY
ncbi:serine protease [Thalassomonas sp. RHCl1]|uniref:S1 family peptidase n=1 Tax=Thalassomonas sp. RHCl1 TaxID=2995320 RepID=UPI00248C34C1|nr:serine protease [Thalassomonas sp. RHCl1]